MVMKTSSRRQWRTWPSRRSRDSLLLLRDEQERRIRTARPRRSRIRTRDSPTRTVTVLLPLYIVDVRKPGIVGVGTRSHNDCGACFPDIYTFSIYVFQSPNTEPRSNHRTLHSPSVQTAVSRLALHQGWASVKGGGPLEVRLIPPLLNGVGIAPLGGVCDFTRPRNGKN